MQAQGGLLKDVGVRVYNGTNTLIPIDFEDRDQC